MSKKKPNKQHDMRGASLKRLGKRFRVTAKLQDDPALKALANALAADCEAEGGHTSGLK